MEKLSVDETTAEQQKAIAFVLVSGITALITNLSAYWIIEQS